LKVASLLVIVEIDTSYKTQNRRPPQEKFSKKHIFSRVVKISGIKFEDQRLTSFSGLVLCQPVFQQLRLKERLKEDYIPVRRLDGNQFCSLAAILAHNLAREIQMVAGLQDRGTTEKRSPFLCFEELKTLRNLIVQRAGRLTAP
jgi:hypothetical protein